MIVWKQFRLVFVLATLFAAAAIQTGCDCNCDELEPLESGDYVVSGQSHGGPDPGKEWLLGAQLRIDRDAKLAIIRYTREGTTYEVSFPLEE